MNEPDPLTEPVYQGLRNYRMKKGGWYTDPVLLLNLLHLLNM